MQNEIRIGHVSSVNRKDGTCRVTYKDKDESVTVELPIFCFTGEYRMPEIDALVLVLHLSNGSAAGIVMGEFWYKGLRPEDPTADWRKDITRDGEVYLQYKDGELEIHAPKIRLVTDLHDTDFDDIAT